MDTKRDPFDCWYSIADAADRLGVTTRTVSRAVTMDQRLSAAARVFFGETRVPWSAWEEWLRSRPQRVFEQRTVPVRTDGGFFVRVPVVARTEDEARRRIAESGVAN
jgi:hypothetical protein